MPTREELEDALRNADAAGDAVAARKLADALANQEFETPATPQPENQFIAPFKKSAEMLTGGAETALALGTSAFAEPVAGLTGLGMEGFRALGIGETPGVEAIQDVQGAAYQPQTESGQQMLQTIGKAAQVIGRIPSDIVSRFVSDEEKRSLEAVGLIRRAGEKAADVGGPVLGTIVESVPTAALEAIGAKGALRGARNVDIPVESQIAEAIEASRQTGIRLFPGQKTLNEADLEKQAFLTQLPASVQKAKRELEAQSAEANAAVDEMLASIAPDDAIVVGAEKFRDASQRAVEKQRLIREEKASPLYREAFRDKDPIDVTDIAADMESVLEDFPTQGQVRKTMNKAIGFMEEGSTTQQLHNAKLEIDQLISGVGENSVGSTTKRQLQDLKTRLLDRIDEANDSYRIAREEFSRLSPPVNALEESIIGKVANLDDLQLKNISRQIFDAQNVNTKVVRDAKKVIDDIDPDAWNRLLRAEIERRMGAIKPDLGTSIENIPGKLSNAIFGSGRQRDVLFAGMEGDQLKNMRLLDTALRRASLGRGRGSQTASRTEIAKELKGGVVQSLRDLIRNPLDKAAEVGEDAAFNARVKALSDAIFDPRWAPKTKKILRADKGKDLVKLVATIEAFNLSTEDSEETVPQE